MSKPVALFRKTNWFSQSQALKRRGSLMVWFAAPNGKPGHPERFSAAAIQFRLSIKGLLGLPLRQIEPCCAIGSRNPDEWGVENLLSMSGLDWQVADYTTVCRRQKQLNVQMPYRASSGPLHLLVDIEPVSATGLSEPERGYQALW